MSNIGSNTKDSEAKSKPPPPPAKPQHLSSSRATSITTATATNSATLRTSKRGLGWPWDTPASHFSLYQPYILSGNLTWLFNWELWLPPGTPDKIEWVPCVRTAAQAKDIVPFLTDILANNPQLRVNHFLGFNEPEIPDQANLGVDEAVRLWKECVLPAKRKFGFRLGSPGMSSDVRRSKPWLSEFFARLQGAEGAEVDFVVVHWYGRHFADMRTFLEDMHREYHRPLWVNEFACSSMGDSSGEVRVEEVEDFVREAVGWLDQCEWVERYAYFGQGQGRDVGAWVGRGSNFTELGEGCVDTEGRQLSRVGKVYAEA